MRDSEHIKTVADTWQEHWKNSDMAPDSSRQGRFLRWYISKFGGFAINRLVLTVLEKQLGSPKGKSILDAGCGTGLNSLPLAARGAEVTLLDIAPEALNIAETYYQELELKANYVSGSIFEMPFEDGEFDLVWNTGVIEHFEPRERKQAVSEMLRVMKPGGFMITFNPNASAPVYQRAKAKAEARGTWDVGFELPIETLSADVSPDEYEVTEWSLGWFFQYQFYKYLIPSALKIPFVATHEVTQSLLPFLNRPEGYFLVSLIRKKQK
ncbi:MAG: methyltransferase domain-containing protein [Bdellovibrionales bacterium]|nr:methyltransferase domain-containing protein [Bdellovibrionales bacterium]